MGGNRRMEERMEKMKWQMASNYNPLTKAEDFTCADCMEPDSIEAGMDEKREGLGSNKAIVKQKLFIRPFPTLPAGLAQQTSRLMTQAVVQPSVCVLAPWQFEIQTG